MSEQILDITEYYGERELRWYQVAVKNRTVSAFKQGKRRILILMPTGSGKTITIACTLGSPEMKEALNVHDRPLRVLFVAHMHRLLTQAEATFAEENNVELTVLSMQSRLTLDQPFDVVVLDEAHHESCMSMQLQLEQLGDFPIIGLTATADRADGCVLKFDEVVNPISRHEAVEQGYLAETSLYTFVDGSERSKADIAIDILDRYAEQMNGTLIFVRTIKEIIQVNEHLVSKGYKSVGLVNQGKEEINEILDQFSKNEVQFIVSANRLGEGIDITGCESILVARTLGSLSLLNQIIGRAARPDCSCNVYEIVNPLSRDNLDATVVTGTPKQHMLIFMERGKWVEEFFDYSSI